MSKKFNIITASIILLAGILIGGFLVLESKTGSADLSQQLAALFNFGDPQDQNEKTRDLDNDGLTDWQEEIYKTDPTNPDTDGDGYLDGEEVLSGYDPTKPAPNDKLLDTAMTPRPQSGLLKINLTEELGKALSNAMQNSSAASTFTYNAEGEIELQNNDLINNALASALAKSPQLRYIPIFQDNDIMISQSTNEGAVKDYITKVSTILDKNLSPEQGITISNMDAVLEALQNKNFSNLDKYIKAYKNSFQEIKQIPTPVTWKEIHKKNLSLLLGSANIFEIIKLADEDPLRVLLAVQQYQQIIEDTKQMVEEAGKLLEGQ